MVRETVAAAARVDRRIRPHAYVCVLGDGHDTVIGPLGKCRPQTRLSNITIPNGKPHRVAVEPQNEVLANFQPVPPIWPQGARFCADRGVGVKSANYTVRCQKIPRSARDARIDCYTHTIEAAAH